MKNGKEKIKHLTKREYFAGLMLQSLLTVADENDSDEHLKNVPTLAVVLSDKLLKALEE